MGTGAIMPFFSKNIFQTPEYERYLIQNVHKIFKISL